MAQNEMKAKAGLPERVRLNEGLGGKCSTVAVACFINKMYDDAVDERPYSDVPSS